MPTIARHFPAYDPAVWNKPWLAHVGTWPDTGHAQLTFAKGGKGDATGYALALDLPAGEVVRWGQKALQPDATTGTHATQNMGWGIVMGDGTLQGCTLDDARVQRRARHPEDATAAPVAFGKGAKGKGKARKLRPDQVAAMLAKVAAGPAVAAPAAPAVHPIHDASQSLAGSPTALAWDLLVQSGAKPDAATVSALLALARSLAHGGVAAPAAAPARPAPVPMAPPSAHQLAADAQVDEDGFPLF